jgi:periplasmic protein CpxP/Spy
MNIKPFLLASSIALGLASVANAQPAPGPAEGHRAHRIAMHGHGHGGVRGMFRQLNLTEAQQDQIFKIHHDQAPAFREQMKKVRAARQELRKLSLAERFDEGQVRRAADAQAKAMSDLAVLRAQTMNRVRSVLTPEQRLQLEKMHEQRRGRGPRA